MSARKVAVAQDTMGLRCPRVAVAVILGSVGSGVHNDGNTHLISHHSWQLVDHPSVQMGSSRVDRSPLPQWGADSARTVVLPSLVTRHPHSATGYETMLRAALDLLADRETAWRHGIKGVRFLVRETDDNRASNCSVNRGVMLDSPRKGVKDSVALLQSGGLQVVMITGDAEETALSVTRSLGL